MVSIRGGEARAGLLFEQVGRLRDDVERDGREILAQWQPPFERRAFRLMAPNLAAYIAFRRRDLRDLQVSLMPYGLSSLGRCESRTLATLNAVDASLAYISGRPVPAHGYPSAWKFFRGERVLKRNTAELFGPAPRSRQTRLMVTLPEEAAAADGALVMDLIAHGMDNARINSAHSSPEEIRAMIANVRKASERLGRPCSVLVDLAGPKMRIERAQPYARDGRVRVGDEILLAQEGVAAPPKTALAICTLTEIFAALRPGARVVVDEGRIEAIVERAERDRALLRVQQARPEGEKLRAEKGLNFPDSDLALAPLTRDDFAVLDAIAEETDLIGYSFVKEPADVALLQREIAKRRSGPPCGIILKIEMAKAVHNLPGLIVQSARSSPTGVMIARGDLAVEIGYRRLAEIQEELLWMCEAASVPVVWATQVLDTFVKKGRRSRAEFTDAAMAERADCVMLNKGPHVVEALTQIDDLLGRMEEHQTKKTSRLRALRSW